MTRYQLEVLSPLGVWTPHGTPARSMTAATLIGLRLVPARDMRVVQVEVDCPDAPETEDARDRTLLSLERCCPAPLRESVMGIEIARRGEEGVEYRARVAANREAVNGHRIRRVKLDGVEAIATPGVTDSQIRNEIAARRRRANQEEPNG